MHEFLSEDLRYRFFKLLINLVAYHLTKILVARVLLHEVRFLEINKTDARDLN